MVAIYIKASWCQPCKVALPKFKAEVERLGIEHNILDAEEDAEQVDALSVRNVPTIILLNEKGEEITRGNANDIIPKLEYYQTL